MVSEFSGNFRRYPLSPFHYRMNCFEELSIMPFQYVSPGASAEGAQHLSVAAIGSEHNNSRVREFAKNTAGGLDSVEAGHLEIHQGNVWPMCSKLLNRLLTIGGFRHQFHVG